MLKSAILYFPSLFLPRVGAFVTILLGANLLAPDEFGYFSLTVILGEFVEMSAINWVRVAMARFGSRESGLSHLFVRRMGHLAVACTFIAIAAGVIAAWAMAPERPTRVAIAVICYVGAASALRFGVALHQVAQRNARATSIESFRAVAGCAAAAVAMWLTRDFLASSLAGSLVTAVVAIAAVTTAHSETGRESEPDVTTRTLCRFAFPLIALALMSQMISSLDKALLKTLYGPAMLGMYAAAFTVARSSMDVIAGAFNIGGFVRLSSLFNNGQKEEAQRLLTLQMGYILALALPVGAALIVARAVIARVFFPASYQDVFVAAIPLIVVGTIALNIKNFVFDNVFHMHLRNLRQLPSMIVGAATAIVIGIVFLPLHPVLGAAGMFAGGSLAALATSAALSSSLMRVTVPWRSVGFSALLAIAVWAGGNGLQSLLLERVSDLGLLLALIVLTGLLLALSLFLCVIKSRRNSETLALSFITPSPHQVTGLSSHAESLVEAVARAAETKRVIFLTNADRSLFGTLKNVEWVNVPRRRAMPYKLYSWLAHEWANIVAAWRGSYAYVSCTTAGSLVPVIDQFFTIHDLYEVDPQLRAWYNVVYARLTWPLLAIVSKGIVCISESTYHQASCVLSSATAKMRVIKSASKYDPTAVATPKPGHFLFVANVQANKNVECLLAALVLAEQARVDLRVEWVGWDPVGIVQRWIEGNGKPSNFVPLGSVSDSELRSAYSRASALVVASHKEGFCLPVLEAHAFGVPVIASDIAVLREVASDGALFFDPASPVQLLDKMKTLVADAELRQQLSVKAHRNAGNYSWTKTARELVMFVSNRRGSAGLAKTE
jgi:glycosyltransferase involved in cell wall biosynthesis/O-antigen/teichoic acid export membrane protein